jgi:hypothetical protein
LCLAAGSANSRREQEEAKRQLQITAHIAEQTSKEKAPACWRTTLQFIQDNQKREHD